MVTNEEKKNMLKKKFINSLDICHEPASSIIIQSRLISNEKYNNMPLYIQIYNIQNIHSKLKKGEEEKNKILFREFFGNILCV